MVLARLWLYRILIAGVLLASASLALVAPDEFDEWRTSSDSIQTAIDDDGPGSASFEGTNQSGDQNASADNRAENSSAEGESSEGSAAQSGSSEDSDAGAQPASAEEESGSGESSDGATADSSSDPSDPQAAEMSTDGSGGMLFDEQEIATESDASLFSIPTRLLAMLLMAVLCASVISGLTAGALISEGVRTGLLLALTGPILAMMNRKQGDVQTRGRILGYVEAHPGIHFSALRDALGLANGVTAHHLYVLEREGEVLSWTHGRNRRYAASGIDPKRIEEVRSPLTGMQLAIMETLSGSDQLGLTATELRLKLEASRQLMSYHLKQLRESEMISTLGSGRKARWSLTNAAELRMTSQKTI